MFTSTRRAAWVLLAVSSWAVAAAEEPTEADFTTSDGVKIHYFQLGDSGTPVVLIHGYMDTAKRMWFSTGIAQVLARNHRVVALDNRNHGKSGKPQPNGTGRAEDVIELMDLLEIDKAHIHGYSMGGGITGRLLASHPERFITAAFGGSGIYESDPALREQAAAMDPQAPAPEGAAAAAFERLRERSSARRAASGESQAASTARRRLDIDLRKVKIPVLAINGEFDRPFSKSLRLFRELKDFRNVVLPGRNHMTAIAVGMPMDPQYTDSLVRFINSNDD